MTLQPNSATCNVHCIANTSQPKLTVKPQHHRQHDPTMQQASVGEARCRCEGNSLGAEGRSRMHCSMNARGTFSKKPRLIRAPAPICILQFVYGVFSP